MTRILTLAIVAGLVVAPAWPAAAQVRASERATVTQVVDGTSFKIEYSRPRARGRTQIFGKVVHDGEVWTPGANWATTLEVNRDVTLDGHAVKKGKYSMWFVVRNGDWTVVLDPKFQLYHEERPDSNANQVRWNVRPSNGTFEEVLTWTFPEVRVDGAVLHFAWGEKQVAINATVAPSHPLTISQADAAPFIGTYEWKWNDSGNTVAGTVELYYDVDRLRQRYVPFPDWYPRLQDQPMVRINDDWFIAAIVRDGKVWEMVADMVFEFNVVDGKATGFELRDDRDNLLGSGRRVR